MNQIAIYTSNVFRVTLSFHLSDSLWLTIALCPLYFCRWIVFGRSVWPIKIDRETNETNMRKTIYFVYTAAIVDQINISWMLLKFIDLVPMYLSICLRVVRRLSARILSVFRMRFERNKTVSTCIYSFHSIHFVWRTPRASILLNICTAYLIDGNDEQELGTLR